MLLFILVFRFHVNKFELTNPGLACTLSGAYTKKNEILRLALTKKDLLFMASPFRSKLNI